MFYEKKIMRKLNDIKWVKFLLAIICIGEAIFIGVKYGSIRKYLLAYVITWFIGCLITTVIVMWKFVHGDTSYVDEAEEELKRKFKIDE